MSDGLAAIKAAGFELEFHQDLAAADDCDYAPWHWSLGTDLRYAQTVSDVLAVLIMNRWGREVAHAMFWLLERLYILPAGSKKTAESLGRAADALVGGGKKKLFTPMYLMVGRKLVAECGGQGR